jgi:hypothetical protein
LANPDFLKELPSPLEDFPTFAHRSLERVINAINRDGASRHFGRWAGRR